MNAEEIEEHDKIMKKTEKWVSNRRCCCCPNTNKTFSLEYNADRLAELTKKQKRDNENMEMYMLPTTKTR